MRAETWIIRARLHEIQTRYILICRPDIKQEGVSTEAVVGAQVDAQVAELWRTLDIAAEGVVGADNRRVLSPFSFRGLVPLAVPLVLMVAVWLAMRRRGRRRTAARERLRTATMIWKMGAGLAAVVCVTVAIVRIVNGVEPYVRFDETTCTVLDRRALPREFGATIHDQLERRHEAARYRDDRPLYYNEPLAAVRVDTAEGPVFATGFTLGMAARTSLSFPELRAFPLGATVPCWIDPEAPTRFTLARSATAGWIVSEVILIGLALVLGTIALRLGRRPRGVGDGQVSPDGRSPG